MVVVEYGAVGYRGTLNESHGVWLDFIDLSVYAQRCARSDVRVVVVQSVAVLFEVPAVSVFKLCFKNNIKMY